MARFFFIILFDTLARIPVSFFIHESGQVFFPFVAGFTRQSLGDGWDNAGERVCANKDYA